MSGNARPAPRSGEPRARLVLIYGGQSAEHEVSCISALHVLRTARESGYETRVVGLTTSGVCIDATEAALALDPAATALAQPDELACTGALPGAGRAGASTDPIPVLAAPSPPPDTAAAPGHPATASGRGGSDVPLVVFPILHGPKGEDGTMQGLLEIAGLPYVGAGVAGSAAAMDKGMAKGLFAAAGIPQARYLTTRANEIDELLAKTAEAELGWPVFVKPANLGSTIGISKAENAAELADAVELALRYDEYLVIEEALTPREIEVAVLGDTELAVSVPGEILPSREFYDFDDKYLAGTSHTRIPADLPAGVAAAIPDLARRACRALRVEGMARVDFFYEESSNRLLVNEVNTIPGFTPISMYPQLWAATGIPAAELLDHLVDNALARHRRRSRFETSRP